VGINKADLSVKLGNITLKNPVMTASGTSGYGEELSEWIDISKLGALVVKGLSMQPKKGNPTPRTCETPSGMLNAIGLENIGIRAFKKNAVPFLKKLSVPVIANFFGNTFEEYIKAAELLDDVEEISGLEANISCPNVKEGGIVFGTDPKVTYTLVRELRKVIKNKTLIVKLSPNVTNIAEMAKAAEDGGADVLSLINTLLGMAIDIEKRIPVLGNVTGGLSGPAIRPVAVRMVWQAANSVDIPIIGMGGIENANDALEFLIAGASAVAVGTMAMVNPQNLLHVIDGISDYLEKKSFSSVSDIVGCLNVR